MIEQGSFATKEKLFLEEHYRLMFLSYLKPLLNGMGHMHLESALIDERRMDLVIDFGNQQILLELKRIYSETNRREAFEQLLGYMESRGTDVGYLLAFDFRKKSKPKAEWIEIDGKRVFEVVL